MICAPYLYTGCNGPDNINYHQAVVINLLSLSKIRGCFSFLPRQHGCGGYRDSNLRLRAFIQYDKQQKQWLLLRGLACL